MKKRKKDIKNVGEGIGADKLELPYYNDYPDDDIDIEFINEDEERKKKKRKALTVTLSIISGVLVILLVAGFFLLKHFVFYPDFVDATKNTVADFIPETEFDFDKFESNGQSTLAYNYDGTYVSKWETHDGVDSNMRITVRENGEDKQYRQVVKDKEFAMLCSDKWYGAAAKDAEQTVASSAVAKLGSAEATHLLTYLEYISKASAKDKDAKITYNFIKKVFNDCAISESEDFHGVYVILDSERYVKSRTYTVNNDNLSDFIRNIALQLREADITVQIAFRNWADMNLFDGEKTFGEMLAEIEDYADKIKAEPIFTTVLEVCYSGNKLSALLITTKTQISEEESEHSHTILDCYSNGAKLRAEKKTFDASGAELTKELTELQLAMQDSDTACVYQLDANTDGASAKIKLTLNKAERSFELVASCGETEALKATGVYSDTGEQFDIKCKSLVRGGKEDTEFQFAVTCYYRTTDIELPAYKNILAMSESELEALKSDLFDWEMQIPASAEELETEINKFFGLDELIEKAKADAKKQ